MELSSERRNELEEQYVDHLIDGCDLETLYVIARESINARVEMLDEVELVGEIERNAPYLLDDEELEDDE